MHDFVVAVVEGSVNLSCLCKRLVGDAVVLGLTGFLGISHSVSILFLKDSATFKYLVTLLVIMLGNF